MISNEILVISLLDFLISSLEERNKEMFFNKYYQLRNLSIDKTTPRVIQSYKNLLKKCLQLFSLDRSFNAVLASSISLSYYLVPVDLFDDELYGILEDCYNMPDARVKANTITAFGEFDPLSEMFKENINSRFNRIAAEAIIVEAKKELSNDLIIKLEEFLGSHNPFFIASGVYIVGQLIQFYQNASKVEMIKLDPLINKIKFFCKHPHEMVRKRALKTLETIELYCKASA